MINYNKSALVSKITKLNLTEMFINSNTEWKAVCWMQDTLTLMECYTYLNNLYNIQPETGLATVEDKVDAFLQTKLKK